MAGFPAFRSRNFRLFFAGQSISLVGAWMQRVAMSWLAYRLTDSEFLLGVVGFSGQIPIFVFTSVAGVFADRWNRRRALLYTQALAMVQAAALAWLYYAGTLEVWHLIALSLVLGLVNAFDMPLRQSFMLEMVGDKDALGSAIALNSSMFNAARMIGPAVAGLLIGFLGEGVCFVVNAVTYVTVLAALAAMRVAPVPREGEPQRVLHELAEGARYAWRHPSIRAILLLVPLVSVVGLPYTVLLPVFARDVLGGGADTLGYLMTGVGLGALVGALLLASRQTVAGLERWVVFSTLLFSVGLFVFALSSWLAVSIVFLTAVGFGLTTLFAAGNTALQTLVQDDLRGRVLGLYLTSVIGLFPFGSLLAGAVAEKIGAPDTIAACAVITFLGGVFFSGKLATLRNDLRSAAGNESSDFSRAP
ncbi:MAG: MFS transporter [Deltaproteobacteria bacterium]|nr:MFS transporter [Deltaproteobacteria bacterium]